MPGMAEKAIRIVKNVWAIERQGILDELDRAGEKGNAEGMASTGGREAEMVREAVRVGSRAGTAGRRARLVDRPGTVEGRVTGKV